MEVLKMALKKKNDDLGFKDTVNEIEDSELRQLNLDTPVESEDGTQVGVVTTGYHSISLDKSICFAMVQTSVSKLGTPLYVRIRKKVFPGIVVKKRFYQTNYKK